MKKLKRIAISLTVVVALVIGSFFFLSCVAERPANLGVQANNTLLACPASPNCVSSFSSTSDSEHYIAPFSYQQDGEKIMAQLKKVLRNIENAKIIHEQDNYLHAEFTSAFFGFVDDVEFLLDRENKRLHVRSASRVGYSDFGANRKRVRHIWQQLKKLHQ